MGSDESLAGFAKWIVGILVLLAGIAFEPILIVLLFAYVVLGYIFEELNL